MFLGLVLTARQGMGGSNIGSPPRNKGAHGRTTDWAISLKINETERCSFSSNNTVCFSTLK